MYDWFCLLCRSGSRSLVVYGVGVGISGLKWLSSIGIGYWSGVVVVVELWVIGFGCRCGSMALVCVCVIAWVRIRSLSGNWLLLYVSGNYLLFFS